MHPHVLLLDEPTNALDPRSQVWLLDVLEEWKREGRTVVIATHDLSAAAESADRIVVLSEEHAVVRRRRARATCSRSATCCSRSTSSTSTRTGTPPRRTGTRTRTARAPTR